jgi:hypothetical protein
VVAVASEGAEGQLDQKLAIEALLAAGLAKGGEGRVDEDATEVEERDLEAF